MKLGIIGLGYVGLPLMDSFCKKGVQCIGFDVDKQKVDDLNNGISFLPEPSNDCIKNYLSKQLFSATTDFSKISLVDNVTICVPTPVDIYRKPNLDYVINSIKSIAPFLSKGTLISLESTTYPGTTREILKPILEEAGFKVGTDIYLSFSPEREDPGNKDFSMENTPKVVSGFSLKCLEKAKELYSKVCHHIVPVSSLEAAETTKLLENIQRSVNIGLMNEMKLLTDKMGLNLFEIVDAAATKPFGFSKYYPGPGVGGHCIPIDPFYLTYKAKEFNIDTRFIELAGEVNRSMPSFVVNKIAMALNNKNLSLKQSRILCLGLSYKKNVGDTRESPPVEIFDLLSKYEADVDFSDPYLQEFPKMRNYKYKKKSIELNDVSLLDYDLVALLTDHDDFDYGLILKHAKIIVDTRGAFYRKGMESENIVIS